MADKLRMMAVARIIYILLVAVIEKYKCEPSSAYINNGNLVSHFGELLKPPPPPPLPIVAVPFHGGTGTLQRQNLIPVYQFESPPPVLSSSQQPVSTINDFKFPAPFYKQYNFNFVPHPQPFTTTPSPSLFNKVSNWLFPSQEITEDLKPAPNHYNLATLKKDCNPCNLEPWIPVIRYDLASKSNRQIVNPTYGPPSPTASPNIFNSIQNVPQSFNSHFEFHTFQQTTSNPNINYGLPTHSYVASTYGPPSPTHTVDISQPNPLTSTYSIPNRQIFNSPYQEFSTTVQPLQINKVPSSSYDTSSHTYRSPSSTYGAPSSVFQINFPATTFSPILSSSRPDTINQHLPNDNNVEIFSNIVPSEELQLPKVTKPSGFRNSYGEPIINTNVLNIPYPVTAAGAESSKVKTKVLPNGEPILNRQNMTLALANPAPFSLNRGRNIHTLQPVALPNLSVSPLPPIFNARLFRPTPPNFSAYFTQGINQKPFESNNFNIAPSIPIAEYTHSVEYPTTYIQSPVIDIDTLKISNQSKSYRDIPNNYAIDEIRDISPEASDQHVSAAKSNQDSSFESTGPDLSNELYDAKRPDFISNTQHPPNHKPIFADLRGFKDEDVDKYRSESNLQHIDSPLLYLKPSAPHKNYQKFISTTPSRDSEYDIYEDIPTTETPTPSTSTNLWDGSRVYFDEDTSQLSAQQSSNHAKIVQIIVPYTINNNDDNNNNNEFDISQQESLGRKALPNTEQSLPFVTTEDYSTIRTSTDNTISTVTDMYDSKLNTAAILNDLYDVKEPPFDIIKLQHTIDDWTEQEYSHQYKVPHKERSNKKNSKQIPDEYFTTLSPTSNYATHTVNYNDDIYDHEFSSSIFHSVFENKTQPFIKAGKGFNVIEKTKSLYTSGKHKEMDDRDDDKLHIYTATSSFRSTTTPAPWGQIQTSISPLTNEKVYVVTSKPWPEKPIKTIEHDHGSQKFESKKQVQKDNTWNESNFQDKPPETLNPTMFGFNGRRHPNEKLSYEFSKRWHRRINNLENGASNENVSSEISVPNDMTEKTVSEEETDK